TAAVGVVAVLAAGAVGCSDGDHVVEGELTCPSDGSFRSVAIEQQVPLLTPDDVFRLARQHDPLLPGAGWTPERTGPGAQRWVRRDGDRVTAIVGASEHDGGWWIDGVTACAN